MDIKYKLVYDGIWIVMILSGMIEMIILKECRFSGIICLAIYIFVQEGLMRRCYGKADCHAFSACAVVLNSFGASLEEYTLLLSLSLIMLTIHQSIRRNIGKKGILIEKVAMIPYISISFFITIAVISLNYV